MRPYVEQPLWELVRNGRFAEARLRSVASGTELRVSISGEVVWKRLFNPGEDQARDAVADAVLAGFERAGWRLRDVSAGI